MNLHLPDLESGALPLELDDQTVTFGSPHRVLEHDPIRYIAADCQAFGRGALPAKLVTCRPEASD